MQPPASALILSFQTARNIVFSKLDSRAAMLLVFLPPALLLFTVFVMLPIISTMFYSPFSWNGYGPAPWAVNPVSGEDYGRWVGLRNFEQMAGHAAFAVSVWNTVKVVLVSLLIQLPLALILALMIYEKRWANTAFRLIFFVPYILAEVATGLIWSFVFDGNYGLSMVVAGWLDLPEAFFPLASREWAFTTILVVIVWKFFGFHMMIFIAGLQSISKEVIEAARIDGATRFQAAIFIKIPMLWSAISVSVFYSVLGSLQIFDLVIPMTAGGPSNASHTLVSYLYTFGFTRMQVGYGSAVGVLIFVVAALFAFTYRRTVQREASL